MPFQKTKAIEAQSALSTSSSLLRSVIPMSTPALSPMQSPNSAQANLQITLRTQLGSSEASGRGIWTQDVEPSQSVSMLRLTQKPEKSLPCAPLATWSLCGRPLRPKRLVGGTGQKTFRSQLHFDLPLLRPEACCENSALELMVSNAAV